MIYYITKAEMIKKWEYHYFGLTAYKDDPDIYIRNDLPKCVQKSVLGHEQSHAKRGNQGNFWLNELPAWWAGFKAQPIGFFIGIIMSMTPSRIFLYTRMLSKEA